MSTHSELASFPDDDRCACSAVEEAHAILLPLQDHFKIVQTELTLAKGECRIDCLPQSSITQAFSGAHCLHSVAFTRIPRMGYAGAVHQLENCIVQPAEQLSVLQQQARDKDMHLKDTERQVQRLALDASQTQVCLQSCDPPVWQICEAFAQHQRV